MTELVALAAIVATVAIVALVLKRPFRGRVSRKGIEVATEPSKPRPAGSASKRKA
jgi:hypothetical protein